MATYGAPMFRRTTQAYQPPPVTQSGGTGAFPQIVPATPATPGFTPDYQGLLKQYSGPYMAQLSAEGIADASGLDAAVGRGVAQFGEVPDFTGVPGLNLEWIQRALSPEVRATAASNTQAGLSTTSKLAKAHADAVRQIRNTLAATGALRSGEFGHQLGEEQQAYSGAQFDARQQLIDYIAGRQAAYLMAERQRQGQLTAYQQQLFNQLTQAFPTVAPTEGTSPMDLLRSQQALEQGTAYLKAGQAPNWPDSVYSSPTTDTAIKFAQTEMQRQADLAAQPSPVKKRVYTNPWSTPR